MCAELKVVSIITNTDAQKKNAIYIQYRETKIIYSVEF